MTLEEFQYIKRAVEALENPETTVMAQHKILRTMGQICERSAQKIEQDLVDRTDDRLYN
jgi:hypothetical protein